MNFIHHRSYAESIVGTQEDQRESFQTREIITICEWIRLSLSMDKAITEHICQMLNVIYWNGVPFLSCKWNKRENDKLSSANTVSNQISTNTPLCAFIRRDVRHCPRHFNTGAMIILSTVVLLIKQTQERTGKPGVLQSTGLQRAGHDWVTGQHQHNVKLCVITFWSYNFTAFQLTTE